MLLWEFSLLITLKSLIVKNSALCLMPRAHTYVWQRCCQSMIPELLLTELHPGIDLNHGTYAQPNPPNIWQNSHPVYHYISKFSWENLRRRRRKFLNIKPDKKVMVMEGMEMMPKCLHLSSTSGSIPLLLLSSYASLLMTTMWNLSRNSFLISGWNCGITRV